MAHQTVNTGNSANDGTGDSLRAAFAKLNANDADYDTRLSALAALVCTPAVLTALVAALPSTLPSQPGVLWKNGNLLQIS